MRITRILLAAALTALAAMAFTATTANATVSPTVTVSNEATGQECSAITSPAVAEEDHAPGTTGSVSGGCIINSEGEARFVTHVLGFEVQVSDCVITSFEMHVNGEGEGWADSVTLADHTGQNDCTVVPCATDAGAMELWPGHVDLVSPGEFVLAGEFCVDDSGTDRECEVVIDIDESTEHAYTISQEDLNGVDHGNAFNCEIDSTLTIKAPAGNHVGIELVGSHS